MSVQAQVLNLLADLRRDLGLAYLFIAHDLSVVAISADRVAVMYLGRVVETATQDELFNRPLHPYTQALLSAVPDPKPWDKPDREPIIIGGDVPVTGGSAVGLPLPHALLEGRGYLRARRAAAGDATRTPPSRVSLRHRARGGRPMTELVLLRHGESLWNAEDRYQGQQGTGLSPLGHQQAKQAAEYLLTMGPFDQIVASDLQRVSETLQPYLDGQEQPQVRIDRRWREIDVGTWGGRTFAERVCRGARRGRGVRSRCGRRAGRWRNLCPVEGTRLGRDPRDRRGQVLTGCSW